MKIKKISLGKTILFSVLVVLIVFFIIRIYHYQVLEKISDTGKAFWESENYNFIVKDVGKDGESIYEYYKKRK